MDENNNRNKIIVILSDIAHILFVEAVNIFILIALMIGLADAIKLIPMIKEEITYNNIINAEVVDYRDNYDIFINKEYHYATYEYCVDGKLHQKELETFKCSKDDIGKTVTLRYRENDTYDISNGSITNGNIELLVISVIFIYIMTFISRKYRILNTSIDNEYVRNEEKNT